MALYEYRCDECYNVFEKRRSMSDADKIAVCPACDSILTTRILSGFAVISEGRSSETQPQISQRSHRAGCPCCVPVHRKKRKKRQGVKNP